MAIRVLLFGRLADIAGWRDRRLESAPATLAGIQALIGADDSDLAEALRRPGVRAAVDRVIALGDGPVPDGAEVAFMPAMSGG